MLLNFHPSDLEVRPESTLINDFTTTK